MAMGEKSDIETSLSHKIAMSQVCPIIWDNKGPQH